MAKLNLTLDEFIARGVTFGGDEMDNGESRYRAMRKTGSGYILTVMPATVPGGWQNAHYHGKLLESKSDIGSRRDGIRETIIVDEGRVATADLMPDGTRVVNLHDCGDSWTSEPGVPHNVYMFAGAVTHCVKFGTPVVNPDKGGADWWPAPEDFDTWSKSLTEDDILRETLGATVGTGGD